jgi:3-(3-hydroxy-phenyl)propionate hydroxylase
MLSILRFIVAERKCAMTGNGSNSVFVIGCGPVGAVMTPALTAKEIPVTLLEAEPEPAEDQRAATIHPPTVEMLFELGLTDEAFSDPRPEVFWRGCFIFATARRGTLSASSMSACLNGEVSCPFVQQWEQYKLVGAAPRRLQSSTLAEVRFRRESLE